MHLKICCCYFRALAKSKRFRIYIYMYMYIYWYVYTFVHMYMPNKLKFSCFTTTPVLLLLLLFTIEIFALHNLITHRHHLLSLAVFLVIVAFIVDVVAFIIAQLPYLGVFSLSNVEFLNIFNSRRIFFCFITSKIIQILWILIKTLSKFFYLIKCDHILFERHFNLLRSSE